MPTIGGGHAGDPGDGVHRQRGREVAAAERDRDDVTVSRHDRSCTRLRSEIHDDLSRRGVALTHEPALEDETTRPPVSPARINHPGRHATDDDPRRRCGRITERRERPIAFGKDRTRHGQTGGERDRDSDMQVNAW